VDDDESETRIVPGFEPPASYTGTPPRDSDHPTA